MANIICQALELGCYESQARGHATRLDLLIQQCAYPVCEGDSLYLMKCGWKRAASDMGYTEEELKANRWLRCAEVTNAEGRATQMRCIPGATNASSL